MSERLVVCRAGEGRGNAALRCHSSSSTTTTAIPNPRTSSVRYAITSWLFVITPLLAFTRVRASSNCAVKVAAAASASAAAASHPAAACSSASVCTLRKKQKERIGQGEKWPSKRGVGGAEKGRGPLLAEGAGWGRGHLGSEVQQQRLLPADHVALQHAFLAQQPHLTAQLLGGCLRRRGLPLLPVSYDTVTTRESGGMEGGGDRAVTQTRYVRGTRARGGEEEVARYIWRGSYLVA